MGTLVICQGTSEKPTEGKGSIWPILAGVMLVAQRIEGYFYVFAKYHSLQTRSTT